MSDKVVIRKIEIVWWAALCLSLTCTLWFMSRLSTAVALRDQYQYQLGLLMEVFDASRTGCIVATKDGKVEIWNEGATAIFGKTAEEMRNKSITDLMDPGNAERHQRAFEKAIAHSDDHPPITVIECQTTDSRNEPITIFIRVTRVKINNELRFVTLINRKDDVLILNP